MSDGIIPRCSFSLKLPWAKSRSAGGNLEEEINDALRHCSSLKGREIRVKVDNGTVYLNGSVDSLDSRRLAADAAWSIAGVEDVVNLIKVNY